MQPQAVGWLERISNEMALYCHNKLNKKGVVRADAQEIHIVRDALPEPIFRQLLHQVTSDSTHLVHSEVSWRTGGAISGHQLRQGPMWQWLEYLTCDDFLAKVRAQTGITDLQLVPAKDTNQISLLDYRGAKDRDNQTQCADDQQTGDGISWHVDGSIYLGDRWTGILILHEDTQEPASKLELKPHGQRLTLAKEDTLNSLVLFRGDHVEHRVRPLNPGEHRIVLSLLFSPKPVMTKNPLLLRYQSKVNQVFYGDGAI